MPKHVFGLIGTISRDEIAYEDGRRFHQLGGILYQCATLCGLGEETLLFANLAKGLTPDVESLIAGWPTLRQEGIARVPGPENRVRLFYPAQGERREVLESAVPELDPRPIVRALPRLDLLLMVVNSGFDLSLASWREIADAAGCPIWFDVHSLTLTRNLGSPRGFRPVPEWRDWVRGAAYLQANRKEVSCLLGRPDAEPSPAEVERFSREALDLGLEAVFITLGRDGGLVVTPEGLKRIGLRDAERGLDTTGCGDVFAAAAAAGIVRGEEVLAAASFGLDLASRAASVPGVIKAYELALTLGRPSQAEI